MNCTHRMIAVAVLAGIPSVMVLAQPGLRRAAEPATSAWYDPGRLESMPIAELDWAPTASAGARGSGGIASEEQGGDAATASSVSRLDAATRPVRTSASVDHQVGASNPIALISDGGPVATAATAATSSSWTDEVMARGAEVAQSVVERTDARVAKATRKIDAAAAEAGDEATAERLAAEFGVAPRMLVGLNDNGASWGDLVVGLTLAANASKPRPVARLIELSRRLESWTRLTAGLGLEPRELTSALSAESRIVSGAARADGQVALIHGEGSRVGTVDATAGLNGGLAGGGAGAGSVVSGAGSVVSGAESVVGGVTGGVGVSLPKVGP